MSEEKDIEKLYNEFVNTIDELNYLLVVLRYIMDQMDNDEMAELDIANVIMIGKYDRQKVVQLREKINHLLNSYNIDIQEIDSKYFEDIPNRIIKNNNLKNKGE